MIPKLKLRMVGGWELFSFNKVFSFLAKSIQTKKNKHCTSDSFPVIHNLWIQNQSNRTKKVSLGLDLLVWHFQNLIISEEDCSPTVFKLYTTCKYLYVLLRLRSMLRTRFVMLALSKASERLNKYNILFVAGTLNSWNV